MQTRVFNAADLQRIVVEVWIAPTDLPATQQAMLAACLDAGELARAARFVRDEDRRRRTCAWGLLRHVLAGYAGQPASALRFETGVHGKPSLVGAGAPLRFSLAHSGGWCAVAVSTTATVGIDIERVRDLRDLAAVAERCFAPAELVCTRETRVPAMQFFELWTLKEAALKALGTGFALDPRDVHVEPRRGRWRADDGAAGGTRRLEAPAGYAAALAWTGSHAVEPVYCDASPYVALAAG